MRLCYIKICAILEKSEGNLAQKRKPKTRFLGKLKILPFFLIIIYILFLLGKTVWQNYGINQEIAKSEEGINQLQEENKRLENLIEYYQSSSYKEQEARLKLGYQKEGEKVFIVSKSQEKRETEEKEKAESVKKKNNLASKSNYSKWWEFFFK